MSPSSIFFNGRLISKPGSYSEVDASGLEVVGLGASGIVAMLGYAVGGKPYGAVDESDVRGNLQVATRPQQPFKMFRSGDLREAAPLCFGPSNDPDIPGGAQQIVFVKTNPAARSSATFDNADGPALVITSADWGYFSTQITVEIGSGTAKGKMLIFTFEAVEEVIDDAGGDVVFSLVYLSTAPTTGFTTITAAISASALATAFTRAQIGIDGDVTAQVVAGQKEELVSSSAADVAVVVEIIGTSITNAAQRELVTLTGTVAVQTALSWNSFHGARIYSGTAAGTVTIRNISAGTTQVTLTGAAGTAGSRKGLAVCTDMAMAGTILTAVAGGASTKRLTAYGLSSTGAVQIETFLLNGATAVPGTALWKRIDFLAMGEVAAATTATVSGTSVNAPFSGLATLQKAADKFNSTSGYTMTVVATNPSVYRMADLDIHTAVTILSPAPHSFYGDLAAIIAKVNANSQLVIASRGTPGTGAPTNTSGTVAPGRPLATGAVFLTGGHEGSTTPGQEGIPQGVAADWQAALDLLTKVRVNSVVVLTADPAVHAQLNAHCQFMGGVGRSERDGFVGLMNAAMDNVPSKTEAKAQAFTLNSRHIRAWAQAVERYNTAGERQEFTPPFGAAILAGMQSGAQVGTSLTNKQINVLKFRQSNTWNPTDDVEEMIQAGLVFGETVDGVGRKIVRNVTTFLQSNNLAFTEGSVNQAVNYAVYNFRGEMERFVGKSGFLGTVNAAKGVAVNVLGLLVNVAIVAWRSLDIQLVLDVLEVAVEIAPVLPINFVESTIHLVSVPQSAAAAA